MMMTGLIDQITHAVLEAVTTSFLQSLVLLLLVQFSMRLFKKRLNAATRYLIWYVFLIGIVCLPFVSANLGDQKQFLRDRIIRSESPSAAGTSPILQNHADDVANIEPYDVAAPFPDNTVSKISGFRHDITLTLPEILQGKWVYALFCVWILTSFWKLLHIFISYLSLQNIKRKCAFLGEGQQMRLKLYAEELNVRRSIRLALSKDIAAPIVAGYKNVMIIVPDRLFRQLSDAEFKQVVLHELAHIRRYDDWTKLGQKFMEALFFFHPVVYWVRSRLDIEREVACDDWVISTTGGRRSYAMCLTALVESFNNANALSFTPKMFSTTPQIIRRVAFVLDKNRNSTPGLSPSVAGILIAAMTVMIFCCALTFPLVKLAAFAKDTSDVQSPPNLETFEKTAVPEQDFEPLRNQITERETLVRLTENTKTSDLPVGGGSTNTEIREEQKFDQRENRQSDHAPKSIDNLAVAELKDERQVSQRGAPTPSAEDLQYAAQLDELMRPKLRLVERKVFSEMQAEIREIETEAYRLSNLSQEAKQSRETLLANERLKLRMKDFQKRASARMDPQVREIEAEAQRILAQKKRVSQKIK